MSATNRGAVRRAGDLYETPPETIRDFLDHLEGDFNHILEPCCGGGNIVVELRDRYPGATIFASDILPIKSIQGANITYASTDYLEEPALATPIDLVITNPPYSLAEKVIRHTLSIYPTATVVMLLRLNFLGSQARFEFWKRHPVTEVYPISCRPSFTGGGTDATDYAWFVWRPGDTKQKLKVIWGR